MFTASNIHYEIADRTRGLAHGGIGAIHLLARQLGLIDALDERLHLLKIHLPFHESDHVLNFAYNALCDGTCLQDMELRRNDEVFLDALGARRSPDPTTAGDFCRRFTEADVQALQDVFDDVRLRVWASQPNSRASADALQERAWRKLERPPHYTVRTEPRRRPDRVKEQIVVARRFDNQRLQSEDVAEFEYRPAACKDGYRMLVVRKNI